MLEIPQEALFSRSLLKALRQQVSALAPAYGGHMQSQLALRLLGRANAGGQGNVVGQLEFKVLRTGRENPT